MNSMEFARRIRMDCIEITHRSKAVHIGGALSMADILAVLYSTVMKYDVENLKWQDRDRLIISKGHACTAVYAALAEIGVISKEELLTQYQNGSIISGHVSHKVPGIEVSTGSLGHGLPIACGMACAAKRDKKKHRIFVLMGDGETEEGTTWEAGYFAAKQELSNLTLIIDRNHLQSTGKTEESYGSASLESLFHNMGWNVLCLNGNDHLELIEGLSKQFDNKKPICIIADTIKGKGVSFMEGNVAYHSNTIDESLYEIAISELGGEYYAK